MLVFKVVGDCPKCASKNSFGNVTVSRNVLIRGCTQCEHSEEFSLPDVTKEIIYLDQFFFSHVFREELPEFTKIAELISKLAHEHLIVCPFSPLHELETHQWRDPQQEALFKFIKRTSRGHGFYSEHTIKRAQTNRAFKNFLCNGSCEAEVNMRDALPSDIHDWDGYFWVDSARIPQDDELTRYLKEEASNRLVDSFSGWRKTKSSFDEDCSAETTAIGGWYMGCYMRMVKRLGQGDLTASLNDPADTTIVQSLIRFNRDEMEIQDRLQRICAFLKSDYFAKAPHVHISSKLLALLRYRVKQGQFTNSEKARRALRGFFFDVSFVSIYMPYCDSMFVDNAMLGFVRDPKMQITNKFGTRFFARENRDEFIDYLNTIGQRKSGELEAALQLIRPDSTQ